MLVVHSRAASHRNMAPCSATEPRGCLSQPGGGDKRLSSGGGGEGVERARAGIGAGVAQLLRAGRTRSMLRGAHPTDRKGKEQGERLV